MTNEREYIIAVLKALGSKVTTTAIKHKDDTGRPIGSVVFYTEPAPLQNGQYVSLFAYRFAHEGSGNGGIIRMSSPSEIEQYLKGDRQSLTDLYMMTPQMLEGTIEDYYNAGTRGANLDYNRIGRGGSNILPQIALQVDEIIDTLYKFRKDFEDEYPDINFIDYMKSSAVLSADYINLLGDCVKVGNTLQGEAGIGVKVAGEAEDGEILFTLCLSNDLLRATKNDLV